LSILSQVSYRTVPNSCVLAVSSPMAHVERSPNSKYKCNHCRKRIKRGQLSVGVILPVKKAGQYPKPRWFHGHGCYPRVVSRDAVPRPQLRQDLSGFDRLPVGTRERLRAELWPNQVSDRMKPWLQIMGCCPDCGQIHSVPLKWVRREQLELECERRDLPKSHKKRVMRECLEQYLESDECRTMNTMLVTGFCRQNTSHDRLNMPIYLRDIVRSYYPAVLKS